MPKLPDDERQRLEALLQCEVLDTPPEGEFDEITALAAELFQVPISLVSLVDETRQWFKSRHGLAVDQMPREISFCTHAILKPGLFEIPDAVEDARFVDNPLVTGAPHIRFYAGTTLMSSDGRALGTLNIIDTRPRRLSEREKRTLSVLGRQVATQLQLRRKGLELRQEVLERQRSWATAEAATKAKSEFIARMSHELRTPLNAIIGFAQLMQMEVVGQRSDGGTTRAEQILRAGQLLLDLANESLDLAQIEAGAINLTPTNQPLGPLIHACVELVIEKARAQQIALYNVVPPYGGPSITVDSNRLKSIVVNLLSNAVKYNSIRGAIVIDARIAGSLALISVVDTGPGIEEDKLVELFKPFSRLGADRGIVGGTGLGLVISKRLAEQMGGNLVVESVVGKGTTFTLQLPVDGSAASPSHQLQVQ